MKTIRLVSIFFGLSILNFLWAVEKSFEYGDLNINKSFDEIKKMYPNSAFQSPSENSSGSIWISSKDTQDGIYYINLSSRERIRRLQLSFEKPDNQLEKPTKTWEESHYLRHPPCAPILASLTKKYGDPSVPEKNWEEAIEWQPYKWVGEKETLTLHCYSLGGKGLILGSDIVMSKISP